MPDYRKKAFQKHGEECWNCGRQGNLEVHHRDGDRTNNDVQNLIPLCKGCHTRVHGDGLNGLEEELLSPNERGHLSEDTTSLVVPLDEEAYDRAKEVKEASGLTWAEFVEEAAEALDE